METKTKTWLLSWNPSNWAWDTFNDDVKKIQQGETYLTEWTCANTNVQEGDRVFLIKLGESEPKGIIASGYSRSKVYDAPHWDESKKKLGLMSKHIKVEFDKIIDYRKESIIEQATLNKEISDQHWSPQASGIVINEDAAKKLEGEWGKLITGNMISNVKDRVDDADLSFVDMKIDKNNFGKNMILYGPPGTGKTYNTVNYAVAIIENKSIQEIVDENHTDVIKRFNTYKEEGKIVFTTFHQSYGYEEFIEGIKPVLKNEGESEESNITYEIKSGVFKEFCERSESPVIENTNGFGIRNNPVIWKVSLLTSKENPIRRDCFNNNRIRIGWSEYGKEITDETIFNDGGKDILNRFINQMEIGDIVLTLYDERTIDAIGVIVGDYEWLENEESFNRSRKVKWIVKDIRENIFELNGGRVLTLSSVYRLNRIQLSDVIKIIEKNSVSMKADVKENKNNYVFIIDEINRGNISKIFGELITLIEETKRLGTEEAMKVKLPYSEESFGVPNNVYILGTMNTADRSIALMDTALRRRFKFIEMMPKTSVLEHMNISKVEGIDIIKMLNMINERIEYLYDREHTIGHAYFTSLAKDATLENLSSIFMNSIIPLLQEYFYEDYSKIQLVLGDNQKEDSYKFILDTNIYITNVFKGNPEVDILEKKFTIQRDAFFEVESYKQIYE